MAVPADVVPRHRRPWTLDEVLALPEDQGDRIELIDGTLVMSPGPDRGHQQLLHRLQVGLDRVVPAGLALEPGINVVLNERRLLIPDLAVTTTPGARGVYATSSEVLLAVEIVSPSSRAYDRVLKHQLYAEAGIRYYLMIDPGGEVPAAVQFELNGADYEEIARSQDGVLSLQRPFVATVDLAGAR